MLRPLRVQWKFCPSHLQASAFTSGIRAARPLSVWFLTPPVADATEHWKWFHWDFDDTRPVRDFGWNKAIKPGAAKRLSWYWGGYLDFEHIGGGDLVLTSALYDDGSRWEDQGAEYACKCIWLKNKKSTFRAVKLPLREGK